VETRTCALNAAHKETRATAIDPAAHNWGAWTVTTPATCSGSGVETRTCTHDSNHKETQPIAALGHDWGNWVQTKAPTETEGGEETRTCTHDSAHTETRVIYSVKFDPDNGQPTWTQTVQNGGKIVEPSKPAKEGLGFYGWHYNGSPWNFNNTVTGPMTLTAQYGEVIHKFFYGYTPTEEDWLGDADPFDENKFNLDYMDNATATKSQTTVVHNLGSVGYLTILMPIEAGTFVSRDGGGVDVTGQFKKVKNLTIDDITYGLYYFDNVNSPGPMTMVYEFPNL
jgi:hypothetical protein